jgi:formamidopyrimidine-DNA glycosylase
MPEVIEVLTYLDFLKKRIKGEIISDIRILNGRYKTHGPFEGFHALQHVLPLRVTDIQSKGKFLYITFENGMVLFSTLGLSGGWIWETHDKFEFITIRERITKAEREAYHQASIKHRNVEFKTAHGTLYYSDLLSFGTLKVVDSSEVEGKLRSLGPDLTEISWEEFRDRIDTVKGDKLIGNVLMNQRIVSGIGNYLRADILWLCKISPFRKMEDLSTADRKKIWKNSRFLAWAKYDYKKGLRLGAIPEMHPKRPEDYDRDFYVYHQETDPAGRPVKSERLFEGSQVRYIFWVPSIQI